MLGSEGTSITVLKEAAEKRGRETKTRDREEHQEGLTESRARSHACERRRSTRAVYKVYYLVSSAAAADVAERLLGTGRTDANTENPREAGRRERAGCSLLTKKGN